MIFAIVNIAATITRPTDADSCHGMPVSDSNASAPAEMWPGQMYTAIAITKNIHMSGWNTRAAPKKIDSPVAIA
jgi:hypothetical protein